MKVLVDSSVWIAYFKGVGDLQEADWLIEEGLIVTNDLILAELVPPLTVRGERKLIAALRAVERIPLDPDWEGIVQMQITCIRHGINKVGIPDLLIAQHAIQHGLAIFSLDRHFSLLSKHIPVTLH